MLGAQPGQGPPAAFDQLGVTVGGAVGDPAHGIERCVDEEAGLFGGGQGPAVPGQKRLEEVVAASPGVGQANQIPYGRPRLAALEVDNRHEDLTVVRLVGGVGGGEDVAELSLGFPELSGNRLMTRPWRSDVGSLECRVLRLFEAAAVLG